MKLGGYLVINLDTVKFSDLKANNHAAVLITSITVNGLVYHDVFGTYISNGDGYLITAIIGTQMLSCQITSTDTKTITLKDIGGSTPVVNNDYITIDWSTEQTDPATLNTRLVNNTDKLVIVKNLSGYSVNAFIGSVIVSDNTYNITSYIDKTKYINLYSDAESCSVNESEVSADYLDISALLLEMGFTGTFDFSTVYTTSLSTSYASIMSKLLNVASMGSINKLIIVSDNPYVTIQYGSENIVLPSRININSVTSNYAGTSTNSITYYTSTISFDGYIGNLQLKFYQDSSGYHMEASIL